MLKKLQAGTGILFAAFVLVHLLNTWLAALGPGAYDGVQALLRNGYQWLPVEALLLAALGVHIVVGIMRIASEPRRTLTLRSRIHRYTGFFLMVVIVGHVLAVRGPSWFFDVYPGFAGLAFTIDYLPGYFYPYYFLLGVAGFYHALNGIGIAAARTGLRPGIAGLSTRHIAVATGFAGVAMVAALLGLGGIWFDVGDVQSSAFAQLAVELLGVERVALAP
jgi:succinate dehydrogenase/fumarate reductase cytochrome b subunit